MENLIIFLFLFALGYVLGTMAEIRHFRDLENREKNLISIPVVTMSEKQMGLNRVVENTHLVSGNVVISIDYFKRILANLRNIFGGEVASYESLVDRARREAVLRMKEGAFGASVIVNLRIETSTIGRQANRKGNVGSVEAFAYGTAIKYKK